MKTKKGTWKFDRKQLRAPHVRAFSVPELNRNMYSLDRRFADAFSFIVTYSVEIGRELSYTWVLYSARTRPTLSRINYFRHAKADTVRLAGFV